jgi:hypothetical protein
MAFFLTDLSKSWIAMMVEFAPSRQSQSSTGRNVQHANTFSIELDDSLYKARRARSGLFEVEFWGGKLARNSICFGGVLFNVSSLSLSLPSPAVGFGFSLDRRVIPRQTERIVFVNEDVKSFLFLAFEFDSQLTRIDSFAFSHVLELRSICLPRSVETIDESTFTHCENLLLLSFERGSKLTRIEKEGFRCTASGDTGLLQTSIHLPASLQILKYDAFRRKSFSRMTIEEGNRHFRFSGNFLMDIEGVTVVRYFGSEEAITLGSEIETLGDGCFSWYDGLLSLVFEPGSKLKRIGARAFIDCSELESICIPASVEILCAHCFEGCCSLSSLTFEADSKLNEIEANVFACCGVELLLIPASVKKIHGSAFTSWGSSEIVVEEGNATFGFSGDFLINVRAGSVVRYFGYGGTIAFESEMESLCTKCFSPSSFTFERGLKLRRIGSGAFANYSGLRSISIPASVESLGEKCFYDCGWLMSVTFESGSNVVRIEARAFYGCSDLESISIPASVESLGVNCFDDCRSLRSVTFESGSKLIRIEARAFIYCSNLPSISIPASVESLGKQSFSGCTSLNTVTFESGSNLARIHAWAFGGSRLSRIVIPRSIKELARDWALRSQLRRVIFESAASVQRMLDGDCVDLSEDFVIQIDNCDSDIGSLGSSIGHRFKHFSHLVH